MVTRARAASRGLVTRAVALALSWVLPATSVWAVDPPRLRAVTAVSSEATATTASRRARPAPASPSLPIPPRPRAIAHPDTERDTEAALLPSGSQATVPVLEQASSAGLQSAAGCDKTVEPILECVEDRGNGQYRAHFGYRSDNPQAITLPVGSKNKFSPSPQDRGQARVFQPGRTAAYPNAAFFVDFSAADKDDDASPDADASASVAAASPPTTAPALEATHGRRGDRDDDDDDDDHDRDGDHDGDDDDDGDLVWTLRGPDNHTRKASASTSSPRCAPLTCGTTFFGPKRYTRTTGSPNVFTDTVTVPAAVGAPFLLRVVNGEANGSKRVSSARIEVNGVEVASPSDFNQNVAGFERVVTLTRPTNTLQVTLQSTPGSYLTINLCGQAQTAQDQTAPVLTFTAPPAWTGDATPSVVVDYQDPVGPVPPSGLALASFTASVDGVDVTGLFTKGPSQATAELTPALADGAHSFVASIKDVAGNAGSATHAFTVDTQPPAAAITSPAEGTYTKVSPQPVTGTVSDLDPQLTVECKRGGETAVATLSAGAFTCSLPLSEGGNTLEVVARDRLGHEGTATREVVLDTTPPQVTLLAPMDGDAFKTGPIAVSGGVVDASPVTVTVNGIEATVTGVEFTASGVPLGPGPEVQVRAVARDRAGNEGEQTITVRLDAMPPVVTIDSPAAEAYLRGPQVVVTGTVVDNEPGVMVEVNGQLATVTGGRYSAQVTSADGPLTLLATARDAAGNEGTASVSVHLDSAPPVIVVSTPTPGLVTRASTVRIEGTVQDASPVVLRLDGELIGLSGGAFSVEAPLPAGDGEKAFLLEAQDAATNASQAEVKVRVDRTPPVLEIASPGEGVVLGGLPVLVQGTVQDASETSVTVNGTPATRNGDAWQASFDGLAEGSHLFEVVAVDAAGNESRARRDVSLDLLPPLVTIDAPATGTLTKQTSIAVLGTAFDSTLQGVTVNGAPAVVGPGGSWSATVPLSDGDNPITAVGTDVLGRTGQAQVTVTQDSVAPVVEVQAPDGVVKGKTATIVVSATDNLALAEVRLKVDGIPSGPISTTGPVTYELAVPDAKVAGDTIVVRGEATDTAGNEAFFQRGVKVLGAGALVGQVLDDQTGLPLAEATVRMLPGTEVSSTDERGRYSLPTLEAQALLVVEGSEKTTVERSVGVVSGVGSVPLDARLTTLGPTVTLDAAGGTLQPVVGSPLRGQLAITVPADAVASPTEFRLTPLSPQGLPGLLPLGFSPKVAFDLRAGGPLGLPVEAQVTGLPEGPLHVVRYDVTSHAFTAVEGPVEAVAGALTVSLPLPGAYALVAADEADVGGTGSTAPPAPVPGQPLQGVPMVELPATVTSEGLVTPKTLPPTGGTATGGLMVRSPVPLPSGTVVQAEVVETYALASGDEASSEPRSQDILLFRTECGKAGVPADPTGPGVQPGPIQSDPGTLCATLPITPSRSYRTEELTEGRVHLDILAGRESVRGKTGGSDPLTLTSEGVVLTVPGLSLTKDTALSVQAKTGFSSFLPQGSGLEALQELVLDFSGQSLGLSAGLSVEGTTAVAGDTVVLARVERVQGIPRLAVVSLASVDANGKVATIAHPDLPGVTQEGRHVFYRLGVPIGIVKGTASAGGKALVTEAAGLPFIGVASGSGAATAFVLVTQTGPVTVKGRVPGTSLRGEAATSVEPPTTANVVLALSGTVTQATVTPANGTANLPTNTQLTIASPISLAAASVTTDKLKLRKVADGSLIPVKLVLSGSGKTVSVLPQSTTPTDPQAPVPPPLEFLTEYRLDAAQLSDTFGGLVEVPETAFTTKDDVPPVYDYGQLAFRLQDGVVTLVAPAGTFPPGTQVLVINANTGEVASFTVGNSGGFEDLTGPFAATFNGSADHTLVVTITDPLGNTTTFSKSQFVTVDGKVLVGPGGGVVTGEGGVELRIPEGALDKGVELTLKGMTVAELEALFPGQAPGFGLGDGGQPLAKIGSGIELKSEQKPSFKKPADLAFPVPAEAIAAAQAEGLDEKAPYFYVVRRIEGPCAGGATTCAPADRSIAYQTIDHAFAECPVGKPTCTAEEKKVVTASWPFGGYADFSAGFSALPGFVLQAAATTYAYLLWTFEKDLPGQPLVGVITGKVQRTEWSPGSLTPTYKPVPGAYVSGVDDTGTRLLAGGTFNPNVAISDKDGVFTLWDAEFKGGTVTVAATLPGGDPEVTCPVESDTVVCATGFEANPADWKTSGLRFHRNIATVNLTFPAQEPPPAPPEIAITVYKLVDGKRVASGGLVPVGTKLVLGITPTEGISLRDVTISGEGQNLVADPLKGKPTGHDFMVETTPLQVATYRVKALGLNFRAEAIEAQTTYRAIGAGGKDETVEGQRPEVLDPDTRPKRGAKGVPVGTSIYVQFSEPVKKIIGNVVLKDPANQPVGMLISGTLKGGDDIIADLRTSPDAVVTSLTLQPLQGLRYTTTYTLELGDGIEDLDTVPRKLEPYTTSFETFGPLALREGDPTGFGAVGMVILEDRAYVMEGGWNGASMLVYETSDPVNPQPIPGSESDPRDPRFVVTNRPVDITGEVESPLGPSRVVAVSTSSTGKGQPSNVWLLDVSDDSETKWIGAVSFTASPQEGWIERTAMRSGMLYAASAKKGIQLVDLSRVKENFPDFAADPVAHFRMRTDLHTLGRGYGGQDVVSIPVNGPAGGPARLVDLDVGVVRTATEPKLLLTAAGDPGLTVVEPASQTVLSNEPVLVKDGQGNTLATLIQGTAVAMGTLGPKDVTVLVGTGSIGALPSRPMLMVVSLLDPDNPVGLGFVDIDDPTVEDIVLKDDLALLGGSGFTTVVSLADPAQPRVAGIIQGIAGRLALSPDGLLFGSSYARFGGTDIPLGGVRTAALGKVTIISGVKEDPVIVALDRKSVEPQRLTYRVIPGSEEIQSSVIEILSEGQVVTTLAAPLDASGGGEISLPPGLEHPPEKVLRARLAVNQDAADSPLPTERALRAEAFEVVSKDPEELYVDEIAEISAVNQAVVSRVDRDPSTPLPNMRWLGPGTLERQHLAGSSIQIAELRASGLVGARGALRLVTDTQILAATGNLTFLPGEPASGRIKTTAKVQPFEGLALVPADGKTVIDLILEEVRDSSGNLVEDGTPIVWTIEDEDGEDPTEEESVLVGGRSTIPYRVGQEPDDIIVRVEAGTTESRLEKTLTIRAVPLQVSIEDTWPTLRATVSSEAGIPADGTPIFWRTSQGRLEFQAEVVGGVSEAAWDATGIRERPGWPFPRWMFIFATVGRARADFRYDTQANPMPTGGPRVRLDRQRIVGGSTTLSSSELGSGLPALVRDEDTGQLVLTAVDFPFSSQATAEITGGQPGSTVRLVLGSTRFPGIEPIAAYPMDSVEGGTVADIYGGLPGAVGPGVTTDSSDPTHFPATYRFDGTEGVTIPGGPALDLPDDFGFGLWVRFDSLPIGAEQRLLERPGAYGLRVIWEGAEPRIEFYAFSGGQSRRVVSHQLLATDQWYQVAARVKGGRLSISVGYDDIVDLGDELPSVDLSFEPLQVGPFLYGNLDELAIYDLTRSPLVTFADGSTERDVVLDAAGNAEVDVFAASPSSPALLSFAALDGDAPALPPSDAFANSLRVVPVRVYQAPDLSQKSQAEPFSAHLDAAFAKTLGECIDGLATGEAEDFAGVGCDISAGFIPGVGAVQAVRDIFVVARNFSQGKQGVADYIKGTFAVVSLVAQAVPVIGGLSKAFKTARVAVAGTRAEARLARQAIQKVSKAVLEGVDEGESAVVRMLADEAGDPEARKALTFLLGVCDSRFAALSALGVCEELGRNAQNNLDRILPSLTKKEGENLVKALGRIGQNPKYGVATSKRMLTLLSVLKTQQKTVLKLSDEALEGLAAFAIHTKSNRRMANIWRELVVFTEKGGRNLTPDEASAAVETLLRNLKQGEEKFARIAGVTPDRAEDLYRMWHNFVARGAGTSARRHSTAGFDHMLKNILNVSPDAIRALDSAFGDIVGRPDLVLQTTKGLVQKEFKNIVELRAHDIDQLLDFIRAAKARANPDQLPLAEVTGALRDELERLVYVFGGSRSQALLDDLYKTAARLLPPDLAAVVRDVAEFSGGGVPF